MLLAQLLPHFQESGSFSCHHNPHKFLQPEVLRLYLPGTGTMGFMVCLAPQLFLLIYLHVNVGLPAAASPAQSASHYLAMCSPFSCPSLPLLPVWMNVSSLTAWVLDLHTVQSSGSSGCFFVFKLVVIFLFIVQGGEAYLSMPPS